jgi:hypothetical protein
LGVAASRFETAAYSAIIARRKATLSVVVARLDRAIQYSRGSCD